MILIPLVSIAQVQIDIELLAPFAEFSFYPVKFISAFCFACVCFLLGNKAKYILFALDVNVVIIVGLH